MAKYCFPRRQALATLGAIASGAGAGCTGVGYLNTRGTADTQFRRGLRNRGATDRQIPTAVTKQWAIPTNRGTHSASKGSPVQTPGGAILLADDTGRIRSLSPAGDVLWSTQLTDDTRGSHGTPAIHNDTAYIGAYDGTVTAIAVQTGEIRWQTTVGDAVGASPTYYADQLYVAVEHATPSGSLVVLDAASGDVEHRDQRPTDHPHSTVAIDRGHNRLVFGSNDGYCYAWSFPGLERRWAYETGGEIKAPIAIAEGIAVVPSWAATVTGIDITDGTLLWEFEAEDDLMCAPAVHDGTVYIGSHDTNVYAINLLDGTLQWQTPTDGWITGSAVATANHVLVGAYDTKLYAIRQDDGTITWSVPNRGEVTSAPLVTDTGIYYTERAVDGDSTRPGMCYKLVASSG
jgi:outer membrane protein assembly factor BamB